MKNNNLKKAVRAFILKDIDRKELENVIISRMDQYHRESRDRKMYVFGYWFGNAIDSLEENYRNYWRKHAADAGRAELLKELTEDGYEYLNTKRKKFYNKILN